MVWGAFFEVNSNIGDLEHFMAELPQKYCKIWHYFMLVLHKIDLPNVQYILKYKINFLKCHFF